LHGCIEHCGFIKFSWSSHLAVPRHQVDKAVAPLSFPNYSKSIVLKRKGEASSVLHWVIFAINVVVAVWR